MRAVLGFTGEMLCTMHIEKGFLVLLIMYALVIMITRMPHLV